MPDHVWTPPDSLWIVRGGVATAEQLQAGAMWHRLVPGLFGFSAQHEPGVSVEVLASAGQLRNAQISVATRPQLVAAAATVGYHLRIVRSPGRGFHCTVEVPDPFPDELAAILSAAFLQRPNPVRFLG